MTESATSPSAVATRQTHRPTAAVSLLAAPIADLMAMSGADYREDSRSGRDALSTKEQPADIADARAMEGEHAAAGSTAQATQGSTKGLAAHLSASEMASIATSSDSNLRAELGARPDCTLTVLAGLVYDHSTAVRVAVAGNPRMMSALSDVLEKDKQAEVLVALAQNPHTSGDVLQRLSKHKNPTVKAAALEGMSRS